MPLPALEPIEFFVRELSTTGHCDPNVSSPSQACESYAEPRPWENAHPKIKVLFQARLPDRLHKKLQWVKQHTVGGQSMQDLLLTGAERFLDERIAEIEGQLRRGEIQHLPKARKDRSNQGSSEVRKPRK